MRTTGRRFWRSVRRDVKGQDYLAPIHHLARDCRGFSPHSRKVAVTYRIPVPIRLCMHCCGGFGQ